MHNLKEIRKDFSKFEKDLEKRSVKIDFNNLQKLDESNRDLIQKKENLEKEKKDISKSKDESLFKKSKEISLELEKVSEQHKNTKTKLDNILSSPNILLLIEAKNLAVHKSGNIFFNAGRLTAPIIIISIILFFFKYFIALPILFICKIKSELYFLRTSSP